ncbi:YggT family protein [Comamonas sp. CMM02]|uniref:YggT family protein n=1 Tax=Comamonas sp. CMM02 TaxID=2769307 RepID=UPI001780F0FE|nr:YggT family protein [Comamonas sp. CMM02]MBD9401558.1 YggT family protein [Comamonas sp. CMM02]
MIVQILQFLLEVISGLIAGACLLRVYMQAQRIPFNNPVGQLVFALSDWIVMPLRKVIPNRSRYDLSSLIAAVVVVLVQYVLLWLLMGAGGNIAVVPLLALFGLLRMVLTGLIVILIVYAILSWVQPHSPIAGVLHRLSEPLLRPLRKVIPLLGGVDLSALVAIIALQVLLMILGNLQFSALAGLSAF